MYSYITMVLVPVVYLFKVTRVCSEYTRVTFFLSAKAIAI